VLFYGWVLVGVAFVTMAVGVTARTAFSLLLPPILDEFGWPRGMTAGAFSFGFLVSAVISPLVGRATDRFGPRAVIESGVVALAAGLLLAPLVERPWHLYATLGVLVGGGANCLGYTGQALYLPNWFVRRRGLAMSLAYSGAGVGAIVLLPWLEHVIATAGWRAACAALGVLVVLVLVPINLLLRHRPGDLGLEPDGGGGDATPAGRGVNVVDPAWVAIDWTLGRAMRTARFWCLALGYWSALFAWYAVQVHQTKYLIEVGFERATAAWALGAVVLVAVPGQIALGHLSDRIGREWVWTAGNAGFAVCFVALLVLREIPAMPLLTVMVLAQGTLGYGLVSVLGAIPAEIFAGRHYGAVFGMLMLLAIGGGAAGPWVAGALYDAVGSYAPAFWLGIGATIVSTAAIWAAAPRRVRAVAGRAPRT
jgi:MFS family permease